MRIFALSDIHINYSENRKWMQQLSQYDYKNDVLIIAGDISDLVLLLIEGFEAFKQRFLEVLFLPRIDVMPSTIPADKRILYPVLGTRQLEQQVRTLRSKIHIYGHSHVNRKLSIDGILYINNAFGYPHEPWTKKKLVCVFDSTL